MKLCANNVIRTHPGLAAIIGCAAVLAGCSGPEVLPPSGAHPVALPAQVKIYQKQPAKYELLGTINVPVTAAMKWDDRGDSTAGFEALQAKAAALGANGVLLKADQGLYDIEIGAGFKGTYYLVPLKKEPRTAVASAIFVLKE
jgi:hypothetical protein